MVINGRTVGRGSPCVIIAEAGVNHNGDLQRALEMVDVAAEAGADVVKFQTFRSDALASPAARKADYQMRDGTDESQLAMLRGLELSMEDFALLRDRCETRGIEFMSTPFDEESATRLVELGMQTIKVPSGELTNHRLLRHVASLEKQVILSTGMATLEEIRAALGALGAKRDSAIAILQCVSCYPARADETNLRAMATLEREFGYPVGLSDHSQGVDVAIAAAALGASILEKHFTLDRGLPGPDHAASLEVDELRRMIQSIRTVESALGDGEKRPAPREVETAVAARRSLAAAREIAEGEVLTEGDIVPLRPGSGIAPSREKELIGMRTRRRLQLGELFDWTALGDGGAR